MLSKSDYKVLCAVRALPSSCFIETDRPKNISLSDVEYLFGVGYLERITLEPEKDDSFGVTGLRLSPAGRMAITDYELMRRQNVTNAVKDVLSLLLALLALPNVIEVFRRWFIRFK